MTISLSTGSTTTGRADYSLICSATLFDPNTLPSDVPSPNFQWSYDGAASLPAGVTATATVMSSQNTTSETYTSTLQFSQLNQSLHTRVYTCQLGPVSLTNSAMVTVNGMHLYIAGKFFLGKIFTFLPPPLADKSFIPQFFLSHINDYIEHMVTFNYHIDENLNISVTQR